MEIGKTVASDRHPNTIDSFWFAIEHGTVVNPFDFVTVEHLHHTKSIGMVQYSQTFIAHDGNTNLLITDSHKLKDDLFTEVTVAKVVVMATSTMSEVSSNPVNMPVGLEKSVRFANADEIKFALGIPEMTNPVPAGIIENTDGLYIPVFLDISYLLGPDTAHVNVSGISGNSKTSYLMFLLQSTCQKLQNNGEGYAVIIFNTKEQDLMHIHEDVKQYGKTPNERSYSMLGLELKPFSNVTYFLPRGQDGRPNSLYIPETNSKTYSYELEDVCDRLELLFSEIYDPHTNLSSILNYIYESWPNIGRRSAKGVKTWTDLYKFKDYPSEIMTHKSTLLYFQGHIHRFMKSPLFIDGKITSTYLGKEIKKLNSGDVFVIDIAMLSSLEEQSFVIGDVMKTVDEVYAVQVDTSRDDEQHIKKPKYVLIFIDEINRFLPKDRYMDKHSAVGEQITKTVIAGRSRGTILFSAQQFKSSVDYTLHENTGLHVTAKVGLSELATTPYNGIDEHTKLNIVRLNKGELVLVHPAFRYPIKIKFPRASFAKP
ncbi:MAG: hypothetical protein WA323_28155 [Candidatus Nitrosopolaris sp.]